MSLDVVVQKAHIRFGNVPDAMLQTVKGKHHLFRILNTRASNLSAILGEFTVQANEGSDN